MRRLFWVAVGAVGATSGTRWVKHKAHDAAQQYRPVDVGLRTARGVAARVDAARRDGRAARADTELRLRSRLLGADVALDDDPSAMGSDPDPGAEPPAREAPDVPVDLDTPARDATTHPGTTRQVLSRRRRPGRRRYG